jgi:hypothetical protein
LTCSVIRELGNEDAGFAWGAEAAGAATASGAADTTAAELAPTINRSRREIERSQEVSMGAPVRG